MNIDIDMDH